VSPLCGEIDDKIVAFLNRLLEGDLPYVWLDATYVKAWRDGRIVSVAMIIAIGVNGDGRRELFEAEVDAGGKRCGTAAVGRRRPIPATIPDGASTITFGPRPLPHRRD
jgi:hypothetical protein